MIQERGKDTSWVHECAEDVVTIGRQDINVVRLQSEGVSRKHAKIIADGEHFFIIDLMSGNGTLLNGTPLKANEKNLLRAGDVISIDAFELRFHEGNGGFGATVRSEEEITESDMLEVKLLKKVLTALDKEMVPSLEVLNGSVEGKKVFFTDEMQELIAGRDPECDFPINEHVISRRHAKISKRWGGITIRDLESKNGTFVNNRRIVEEFLHDGDRIALGTIVLLFRNPQEINLSQLVEFKPRYQPAAVSPADIPGIEEGQEAKEEQAIPQKEINANDEASALEEWDKLEKSLSGVQPYPTPEPYTEAIKRLTPLEIGLIGLGTLVLIFAIITIVNLMAS